MSPSTFRAAVLHEVGQPLVIERLTLKPLGPHDVLVQLRASGLCHTDLEVIQGQLVYPVPIVLGHEGAGLVEAVGAGVTLVRPGDHVCSWNPSCGHCFYCDRDQPILCELFTSTQPWGQLLDGASRLVGVRCTTSPPSPRTPSTASCTRRAPCRSRTRFRSTARASSAAA